MKLSLVPPGDPILSEVMPEVKSITKELKEASEEMRRIMRTNRPRGIGLAAPQVGLRARLIVLGCLGIKEVMINPQITIQSEPAESLLRESCLTAPLGLKCWVKRSHWIRVQWRRLNGSLIHGTFHGLPARVIQHEIDHLNGIQIMEREVRQK